MDENIGRYYERVTALLTDSVDDFLPRDDRVCCLIKDVLVRGKQIRPVLTLLSFQAVGGRMEDGIPLALAVELTHNATIVHDDIIDGDMFRRGEQSLHGILGVSTAIVVGDAMISLAVHISTAYGAEVTKLLSGYGLDLCSGELLDISLRLENATEEDYLLKIRKKSASLFRAATHTGALAAKGSLREVDALANFGEHLGVAYQIKDDVCDLVDNGEDLRNGVVTLPMIYLYGKSDDETRGFLRENFGNRDTDEKTLRDVIGLMDDYGSFDYCNKKIAEYVAKARSALDDLQDSSFKEYLLEMPEHILFDNEPHRFDSLGPWVDEKG